MNVYSTLTHSDTSVLGEARLSSWSVNYNCEAVNSAADTYTYVVLHDTDSETLNLLKLSPVDTGSYTLTTQLSA